MSNLVFLRKFALRFALGLAVLGTPHVLLADKHNDQPPATAEKEDDSDGSGSSGSQNDMSMTTLKNALNQFLSGVDIQGCSSAVNSLSQLITSSTGQPQ